MVWDASDSILLVVDFQRNFLDKMQPTAAEALLRKAGWLIGVAQWLRIPVFATVESGEYPAVAPSLQAALEGTPVFCKTTYNAALDRDLANALAATGRRSIAMIGFETDVCVAQSALGLRNRQYRVTVVSDAVHAPGEGHAQGLDRMRAAGVTLLSVRGLYFEWMADVGKARAFQRERPDLHAAGVIEY